VPVSCAKTEKDTIKRQINPIAFFIFNCLSEDKKDV